MIQGPRARSVPFSALCFTLLALLAGCSGDDGPAPATGARGRLVQHGSCKSAAGKAAAGSECLAYAYDGDGVLHLTHTNAVFNCCPTKISAEISIAGHAIRVEEKELLESPCDCLCLYDVEYEFLDIEPGSYQLNVVEPYLPEGEEPLSFTIDLAATPSDTLCAVRSHYPWDTDGPPSGTFVGATGCKGAARGAREDSLDCVSWQWDGSSILHLIHRNAGYNCCPDTLGGIVSVNGGVVRITEFGDGDCRCECLYDLEYRVEGLAPGTYRIEVAEPNLPPCDEPLAGTAALGPAGSGGFCVERSTSPWMQ